MRYNVNWWIMKESNLTAATQHMSNRFTDGRWEHDPETWWR